MGEEKDSVYLSFPNYEQTLCRGINAIYEQKDWADLVLNVSGKEMLVHTFMMHIFAPKVIAYCDENRCDLPDVNIDQDILTNILEFIYKGRVKVEREKLAALAGGAELLGISILQQAVKDALTPNRLSSVNKSVISPEKTSELKLSNNINTLQENLNKSKVFNIGKGAVFKCSQCDFKEENIETFKDHLNKYHKIILDNGGRLKLTYKCKDCDFESEQKLLVLKHRKSHQVKKKETKTKFKCCHCEFVADRKWTVSHHIKNFHSGGTLYKCDQCEFGTRSAKNLKTHITNRHNNGDYQCSECDRRFTTNAGRLKHHVRTHVEPEVRNSCQLCDFRTKLTSDLRKHLQNEHNIFRKRIKRAKIYNEKRQCPHCESVLKNKTYLIDHLAYKHQVDLEGNTIEPKYKCRSCDFVTFSHIQLYRHNYKLHSKVEFRCEHCDFKARARKVLSDHIQWKHFGVKRYMCESCGSRFSTEYALTSHQKVHSSPKPISSPENKPKRSVKSSESSNQIHQFKCEHCDKVFFKKAHLKQHNFHVHDVAARKHHCDRCSYVAKTRWNLAKHVKSMHKVQEVAFFQVTANNDLRETEMALIEVQNFELVLQEEPES